MSLPVPRTHSVAHATEQPARSTPIELLHYLQILRRRWLLVVLTVVFTVAAAYSITPREPVYAAEATLFVGSPLTNLNPSAGEVSSDRLVGISYLAATYVEMIESYPVASSAIDRSGAGRTPDDLLDDIDATSTGTQLITVEVTADDPAAARELADAVSLSFVEYLRDQEEQQQQATGAYDDGLTPVSLFAPAQLPTEPEPNGLVRNVLLALLFGGLVAGGLVILLEYLDLTLRTPEDIERRIGLPVLGVIPVSDGASVAGMRHLPSPARASGAAGG